jgi:hypothetical protein
MEAEGVIMFAIGDMTLTIFVLLQPAYIPQSLLQNDKQNFM